MCTFVFPEFTTKETHLIAFDDHSRWRCDFESEYNPWLRSILSKPARGMPLFKPTVHFDQFCRPPFPLSPRLSSFGQFAAKGRANSAEPSTPKIFTRIFQKRESQREKIFNSERRKLSVFSFVLKSRHFDKTKFDILIKQKCRHFDKIVEKNNSTFWLWTI